MTVRCIWTVFLVLILPGVSQADWPQWRGPNRDAKVAGFTVPAAWPEQLTQKWKVTVGDGVATPALVGDNLFVFSRQGENEVIRCLDAESGKELWQYQYAAQPATGPASRFPGPRSSPTVAEGKVLTIGVRGKLTCLEADTGKMLWQKDDFGGAAPQFFAASSPIVVDGVCIAQLGGSNGAAVAYDLASGAEKWRQAELPTAYASPVLMTVGGTKLVIAQVSDGIVAIEVATGKKVWEKFFDRGGSRYKAATPIVDGDTLIYLDGPPKAVKLEKQGDKLVDKELWANEENRVEFNTPVLKNGLLFGLGRTSGGAHHFFCFAVNSGKTMWTAPAPRAAGGPPPGGKAEAGKAGFGKGGFGKGGFGGGGGTPDENYGSIVDAGSVIITLTPSGDLLVLEPTDKEFKPIAKYKVADGGTYAYPVLSGNRIYIKDRDGVALWTIQ